MLIIRVNKIIGNTVELQASFWHIYALIYVFVMFVNGQFSDSVRCPKSSYICLSIFISKTGSPLFEANLCILDH